MLDAFQEWEWAHGECYSKADYWWAGSRTQTKTWRSGKGKTLLFRLMPCWNLGMFRLMLVLWVQIRSCFVYINPLPLSGLFAYSQRGVGTHYSHHFEGIYISVCVSRILSYWANAQCGEKGLRALLQIKSSPHTHTHMHEQYAHTHWHVHIWTHIHTCTYTHLSPSLHPKACWVRRTCQTRGRWGTCGGKVPYGENSGMH